MKMPRIRTLSLIGLLVLLAQPAGADGRASWQDVADQILTLIDRAEEQYRSGDKVSARRAVVEAYFGVFEDQKMEAAVRTTIGANHAYLVERQFGGLRKAIKKDATAAEVHELAERLREAVARDAAALDEAGVSREVFRVNE